jgi:uncharacterized protein YndB with AHSA1/START domain
MITQLFKKKKDLNFERTYEAPVEAVWAAWTEADKLREWWGPENTTIRECEIDLRVGGEIRIVMEAGEGMGKYQGTRWPLAGTFSRIEENARLIYDARSWTEGEEETTTIHHVNDLTLTERDGVTVLQLHIAITSIGSGAKMAAFGMKWGYKQQLDTLDEFLSKAA